ncbi:MAG: thioredoxin [Patescibacteria group bacterium]
MELTFTDSNFEQEVLKSSVPVFVDFWAPWCGPCRMSGPIVDEIAKEMEGKNIKIGKMNVDENQTTPSHYNILSIPSFMIFKGGQVVDQLVGGVQKEKLEEMIKRHL